VRFEAENPNSVFFLMFFPRLKPRRDDETSDALPSELMLDEVGRQYKATGESAEEVIDLVALCLWDISRTTTK